MSIETTVPATPAAPVINPAPAAQPQATLSGWKAALIRVGILTGVGVAAGAAGFYAGNRAAKQKAHSVDAA